MKSKITLICGTHNQHTKYVFVSKDVYSQLGCVFEPNSSTTLIFQWIQKVHLKNKLILDRVAFDTIT